MVTLPVINADGDEQDIELSLGYTASATFTPAAAAHTVGDIIGTAQLLSGIGPSGGGEVLVTCTTLLVAASALVTSESSYALHFYSATPPSARVDGDAWDLPSGDRAYYLGKINLGTPVDIGASLWVQQNTVNVQLTVPSGGRLYAELVTDATMTPTAVARTVTIKTVAL